jgi:pantoate--beta-alanine ligase
MLIFTKIVDLQAFVRQIKNLNQSLGFVPTMGALHNGHISLIEASRKSCQITICSIFVNPTQFNDKKDLERYPRTPDKDIQLLEKANCSALFLPDADEIYPKTEEKTNFDFGNLDKLLEGKYRPGHFNGVAQVVKRLFEIVTPHKAFFGSKDFQQVLIVKALTNKLNLNIDIISCPILREPDGLAMSSRNTLLNNNEREIAGLIPKIMRDAKLVILTKGIIEAKQFVLNQVSKEPLMNLDYFEICNPETLENIIYLKPNEKAVVLIAVFVGKIRLIDNLIID